MRGRNLTNLIVILVLAFVAIWIDLPDSPGLRGSFGGLEIDRDLQLRLGLDLQGGLEVLLGADLPEDQPLEEGSLEAARGIIENRVNALGVSEPLIQIQGSRRVVVELPGVVDPERAIATIGQTGLLEFAHMGQDFYPPGAIVQTTGGAAETPVPGPDATATPTATPTETPTPTPSPTPPLTRDIMEDPQRPQAIPEPDEEPEVSPEPPGGPPVYETIMTGANLESASTTGGTLGELQIAFTLDVEGTQVFADYTRENAGQVLCIILDKRVVSCATIAEPIDQGQVSLTRPGGFGLEEAESIVIQLRYGSLPVPLRVETIRTVGPTLGEDSILASQLAGALGLAVVATFMLLYYRLPGLLANVALGLYALFVFALFKLIPVVLTLAGIAGFILSIGMAVDANILIFERLKEELRAGKGLRLAVEVGFRRAWPSIRDSNVSTLITCAILFWFGSTFGASVVKGFALTLAVGVLVSMFTAIVVSRSLLRFVLDLDLARRLWWFGV